jgi:imidazole glycerol-phosphate synthase subunit HisH
VRVALIDYRAGNLASVRKALEAVAAQVCVPALPGELQGADAVVIPGVGHFGATASLDARWRATLLTLVEAGRPLLGICLGMQFLFEGSDEAPLNAGLGLLPGRCTRLVPGDGDSVGPSFRATLKVPHVGWNELGVCRGSRLLDGIADGAQAYFTHSYVAPVTEDTIATTTHGEAFASAVERGHVFGAQFHPEKSGDVGLRVLQNFVAVVRAAR